MVRTLVHVAWTLPDCDETPYSDLNFAVVGETGLEPATPGPPDQSSKPSRRLGETWERTRTYGVVTGESAHRVELLQRNFISIARRFEVSVEPRVVCVGPRRLPVEIGGK